MSGKKSTFFNFLKIGIGGQNWPKIGPKNPPKTAQKGAFSGAPFWHFFTPGMLEGPPKPLIGPKKRGGGGF